MRPSLSLLHRLGIGVIQGVCREHRCLLWRQDVMAFHQELAEQGCCGLQSVT